MVSTKGDLLAASGGSPVVRGEVPAVLPLPGLHSAKGDSWAVAFLRPTHVHGVNVMLHAGDANQRMSPTAVATLEAMVRSAAFVSWLDRARDHGATHVSLPRGAVPAVGDLLADPSTVGLWEWMWTEEAPADAAAEVLELGPGTRAELEAFLARYNARTDGRPFAHPDQRWVGVRDDGGRLLAVGCCETERSGTPILAGITTAAEARSRGLGRAVTAELTRGAVTEHGWCTLGMYSDNPVARHLYLALGYQLGAEWTSGALTG